MSTAIRIAAAVVACAAVLHSQVRAQDRPTVSLSGEIRLRGEWDGRTARVGDDAATLSRIRLGAAADVRPWLRAFIQLQDARAWGTETNTLTDASADAFDLHQGYVELGEPGRLRARIGRQQMILGDERLVGAVGWANTGRVFDGARVAGRLGSGEVDLFWMTVAERDAVAPSGTDPQRNEGADADGWFMGAFHVRPLGPAALELGFFHDRRAATEESYTASLRARGEAARWLYEATVAYQFGARRRAHLTSLRLGRAIGAGTVAAQVDYLSGDADPGDRTRRAFHTLYATNHVFYGLMDYFLALPGQTGERGLVDVILRGTVPLGTGWRGRLDVHHLSTARALAGQRELGVETDVLVSRRVAPGAELELGASAFVPRPLARTVMRAFEAGREWTYWGYAQMTVRFP